MLEHESFLLDEVVSQSTQLELPAMPERQSPIIGELVSLYEPMSPPADVRLIPSGEKFTTPVDDRGIVRENELIKTVQDTVMPGYEWRGRPNVHHLYWESSWYRDNTLFSQQHQRLFRSFVDLPVHKLYLPTEFHNYLHTVTEPVEPPDPDVMHMRVEGWNVAMRLFKNADGIDHTLYHAEHRARRFERDPSFVDKRNNGVDLAAARWYVEMMRKHFTGIHRRIGELERVPEEFRFVDPLQVESIFDDVKPTEVDPVKVAQLRERFTWIGSVAAQSAVDGRPMLDRGEKVAV